MTTRGSLFPGLEAWDAGPLRQRLRQGGFHQKLLEALGMEEHWMRSEIARTALLRHVPAGSSLETLVLLFTLGEPVAGDAALRALGDAIHGLLEIGFLQAGGGTLRSLYQICPFGETWAACDFRSRQLESGADHVMGIGPSSLLLASLTPPGIRGRALELACGIGWLAGMLAQAGMEVTATDVSHRALDLARFSAKLTDGPAVDFRQGDGFSSVAGETFDLIVANPPYVQSPGGPMTYREAPAGDPICARLLREIPARLAPGGIAVVLLNWTHATDDDWRNAPLSWVPPEGIRRWLFQTDCSSPADYAWKWIPADPRFTGETAATAELARWLAHYRDHGVNRVSGGFMVLQNCPAGGEWTRTESRALDPIARQAGGEVLRVLDNETWLAGSPALLESHYVVPDGTRAEAGMVLGKQGWERETIRLTSPAKLSYDGQIDENLLRLLAIVREGRPPSTMIDEIRARPEFAAIADLPERITELVRELVRHGVMVPK